MHAVQQLADGDDADRVLLVRDERFELPRTGLPLPIDQQVGVDQDGQGASGAPTESRIARASATKSSSTGGAEASSSRNLSAERSRALGGEMTATGAPARVTSISSPAATRFRTSEKRRATSVALNRVMPRWYLRNQASHGAGPRRGAASVPRGRTPDGRIGTSLRNFTHRQESLARIVHQAV